jgi:hypothetical protein
VPAALLVAQRDDLHVAHLDGAKRPVAHGGSLAEVRSQKPEVGNRKPHS